MNLNTLTLYMAAGGLSLGLGLVLLGLDRLQKQTLIARSSATAILILAVAFLGSGVGPMLPRWATVVGTNILLLSAGLFFYSGFSVLFRGGKAKFDRSGWALVTLTAPLFWYWGLVEPNGHYRSAVFSLAAAIINGRTGWNLLRSEKSNATALPIWFLSILFCIVSAWMLARGILALTVPAQGGQVGGNPTLWITVFWYNVIISLLTVAIVWLEIYHLDASNALKNFAGNHTKVEGNRIRHFSNKLVRLWIFVVILFLALLGELTVNFGARLQSEQYKVTKRTQLLNDAFVEHSLQVITQVDTLLKAGRGYYERTRSISDFEKFISILDFPRDVIEDIHIVGSDGQVLLPVSAHLKGINNSTRDFFLFHQMKADDELYIGPTEVGRVVAKKQFRLSRRIANPDGSFGGVILIPVEPKAFAIYYDRLLKLDDGTAALVGTEDRRIRVRVPDSPIENDEVPIDSPLWKQLAKQAAGSYRNISFVDRVQRELVYKRVGKLPLVVVTGFSDTNVLSSALEETWPVAMWSIIFMMTVVALSVTITFSTQRREAQSIYLAALKEANDRAIALFNTTNDAVIMLDDQGPFDCNHQAVMMFGASSKEQFLSLPPWSPQITVALQAGGKASEDYQRQCIASAISDGSFRGELIHKRLDNGDEFQVDIVLTAIQLNGKTVLQAVLRDISEHIRAEKKLQVANEELARINEDQDRFLSMLSHELKTPLAVLRMSIGKALEVVDVNSRSRIIRAIADINAIVERSLQSDRLEHGHIEVEKKAIDPNIILRHVVSAFSEHERVQVKAATLPELVTDMQLLQVILTNLIDNAIKYGYPDSPIIISAEQSARDGKDGLAIAVVNQVGSAGMPDPQQIFRRYYRAAGAHAKTGSGLGMYIATGFARMIGGELSYQPQDKYVKFELWVPN